MKCFGDDPLCVLCIHIGKQKTCRMTSVLRELDHNLCGRMFRVIYPLSHFFKSKSLLTCCWLVPFFLLLFLAQIEKVVHLKVKVSKFFFSILRLIYLSLAIVLDCNSVLNYFYLLCFSVQEWPNIALRFISFSVQE